jgi:hypothetical protein
MIRTGCLTACWFFVEDAVLASAVGDLDHDKVALSRPGVEVTLSTGVSIGVGL